MWFGIAAIITAGPVYFGASIELIVATYGLSVLFLTLFVRKITLDYMSHASKGLNTNATAIVNSSGVVVQEIDPIKGTGQVRIGREIWTAVSEGKKKLAMDTEIRVISIQGAKVIVEEERH